MTSTGSRAQDLILVDSADTVLGSMEREACHAGAGRLHRAFSILLFDDEGRVLLQQRSPQKKLWPGYWSNSCCGHPQLGEETPAAARRRLGEELGTDLVVQGALLPSFRFQYSAAFDGAGSERELCRVFLGRCQGLVNAHPDEVSDWYWASPGDLNRSLEGDPMRFTPWFRVIWRVLRLR